MKLNKNTWDSHLFYSSTEIVFIVFNREIGCAEIKYWRTIGGENCPLGAVVETEDNCIEAASQLGLIYHPTGIYVQSEAPAGCWVTGANDVNVYFNNITDPALTDPVGPHLQGICTMIGTEHLLL